MHVLPDWGGGRGGKPLRRLLTDLFLKNKSSVLETCNTLAVPLVCKVLSRFRHVELFFSFCKASWVPATVWKCIQRTSASQNYCMLPFPACTGIWGNLCGWSITSEVKHSHRAWLVNWVYPSAIFSLRLWPCTHTHTHASMGALHLWHHRASF